MIPFLDLKKLNAQYREELIKACIRVIDSGWYILGEECKNLRKSFQNIVEPSMQLVWAVDLMHLP